MCCVKHLIGYYVASPPKRVRLICVKANFMLLLMQLYEKMVYKTKKQINTVMIGQDKKTMMEHYKITKD